MMDLVQLEISRRSFLKSAAPFGLGFLEIARRQTPFEHGRFSEDDVPLARVQLLRMVNEERSQAGLGKLQLENLACKVASDHALDMAKGVFLSHWGSDGRKPYHRYSFAGGTDAVQENASSADDILSLTPAGILKDLHDMHLSMLNEKPSNDGHRRTILFPMHTHVGFGIALQGFHLRLAELYVARYVRVDPIPQRVKPKQSGLFSGRVLNPENVLAGVDVYYEPLPTPPQIEWLRVARSYGMPDERDSFQPRLPAGAHYTDGTQGEIEMLASGNFRLPISLSQIPGINTIMVWVSKGETGIPFPASQICILVE
jgi:hypothetical protein